MKKLIRGFATACAMATLAAFAEPLSLSINFAGARANTTVYGDLAEGEYFGAWSVKGDLWNNVRDPNNTALGDLVWSDGNVRPGVTLSTATGGNWTTGKAMGLFYSYLDSGNSRPDIVVDGLTAANGFPGVPCTVYIYVTTDSANYKLYAMKVNNVQYTGVDGQTREGTERWGSSTVGQYGILKEGADYLRIAGITPNADGQIHIVGDQVMSGDETWRAGVCAIQLVFDQPGVTATCAEGDGTLQIDGGAAAFHVGKNGDFGSTVTATLTAIPAAGRAFKCWTGDTDAITSGAATDATVTVTADAAKKLKAEFGPADDHRELVLSINISGPRKDSNVYGEVTGAEERGYFPVAGDYWNNIPENVQSGRSGLVWNNGMVLNSVRVSNGQSGLNWATGTSESLGSVFYSYMDDGNPYVEITGLDPAIGIPDTCTVCVYMAADNVDFGFTPPTVNGTQYTFGDGRAVPGAGTWGNSNHSRSGREVEGGDFLVIREVPIVEGKVRVSTYSAYSNGSRGGLAAVQLAFNMTKAVTVTATSADAAMGLVQFDGEEADATVSATGDESVTKTLRAIPAPGYLFLDWTGGVGIIAAGTATDPEITVDAKLSALITAEFVADNVPATATWTGAGDRANASDPGNWDCRTASGTALPGALPTAVTLVTVAGDTSFNLPVGQSFLHHGFSIGDCRLTEDCDWRGLGAELVIDGTIDLNGHKLYVDRLVGAGTITDTKGDDSAAYSLSVNFNGTRSSAGNSVESRGTLSGLLTFGAEPVAGSCWNNIPDKDTVDLGGLIWNDGEAATGITLTAGNKGVVYTTGTAASEGSLFYSYLDDATAKAKISGLTLENGILSSSCTVYVYMVSDSASKKLKAVTVNGTTYYGVQDEDVVVGSEDWGNTDFGRNGRLVQGGSYLKIENVPISGTGEIEIAPVPTTSAAVARGGLAAFQIAGLRRAGAGFGGGELHVDVPEGETLQNVFMTLTGSLKLVKDGAGTFVPAKASQSYVGGTEVTAGGITLGTAVDPLGAGNGLRQVTVDAGAFLDFNGKIATTTSRYNFVLGGGTLNLVNGALANSWSAAMASLGAITLTADSHITGKFFHVGHNSDDTPLTLNGHTLNFDNDDYIYFAHLKVQDAGTIRFNGAVAEFNPGNDLSKASVFFANNAYVHLSVSQTVVDFAYERNFWGKHNAATWISVGGRYQAGPNRPPLIILDGATLDLADWPVGEVWDSTGLASPENGGNNKTYSEPALVSFAEDAAINVVVGDKRYPRELTKLVNWDAAPAGTTFELDPESKKKNLLLVKDDGLYILNVGGMTLIFR